MKKVNIEEIIENLKDDIIMNNYRLMKEPEASANENCESFILIGKLQML